MEGLTLFNRLLGDAIIKWTEKITKNEPFSNQGTAVSSTSERKSSKTGFSSMNGQDSCN